MKKITAVIAFLLIGFAGFSQTDYKQKTIDLITITSGPQFDVVIQPFVDMVPEQNREALKKDLKASMVDLYDKLAVVYMESYTEEDVDAILAFYETPVGKKMISETPEITKKSMQIGQMWGMQLQPLIAKYSE
ncbi:DUF2059 domain-containing protein [Antarcticibacterium sp. 1MA-6-2]|uniref:DUF2059 domain-containing protein n=1 Tax=Antarcticibacterium sp. 1MA-6-2 TaxID=2908210 RepID=UPI001F34499B|nr:DUF2059 domain-containing protein [Antarcticibacterium sp. 1MA-6-2]UJH91261.1 DUF2059 domain-containing protein [Antarcticibacterium sp. 1MA-6-2]